MSGQWKSAADGVMQSVGRPTFLTMSISSPKRARQYGQVAWSLGPSVGPFPGAGVPVLQLLFAAHEEVTRAQGAEEHVGH